MGTANPYGTILFSRNMVILWYGRKGIYSICVGLFILRNCSRVDFHVYHVHKEKEFKRLKQIPTYRTIHLRATMTRTFKTTYLLLNQKNNY